METETAAPDPKRFKGDHDEDDNSDIDEEGGGGEVRVKILESEFSGVANKPLWLEIVRFLSREDLDLIDEMPELRGMGLLVKVERRTVDVLEYIRRRSAEKNVAGVGNPIGQLDVDTAQSLHEVEDKKDFWYSWGADKAGFGSLQHFHEFCMHAGICPFTCIKWTRRRYSDDVYDSGEPCYMDMLEHEKANEARSESFHFLSADKKVVFECQLDPTDGEEAYVHYLGMTGQRERVKWLASWFHENCVYDEICYGGRDFI